MSSGHLRGPFRKRLDAFSRELVGVEDSNVEAVHRARVASRRLRELIPLLELESDLTRKLARRLRKVTRRLGTVRELDVLMLLVQELAKDGRYAPAALVQLAAAFAQERADAGERLSARLPTAKLERLARSLGRICEGLDAGDADAGRRPTKAGSRAWVWALEACVSRRGAGVRGAIEAAGTVYAPERLHGVRIAVKKLRYSAELVAEATRKRLTADLAVLKDAQDLLGRLHDLEVLLVRARAAQASAPLPDLTAWRDLGVFVHVIEGDCRTLHARYMRDRAELMASAQRIAASRSEVAPIARTAV